MLVVLDTNILVSALLSPFGPPARVFDMVLNGDIRAAYDDRLMAEYREVLARPKFNFAPEDVAVVLEYLEADGEQVTARPLSCKLPDPDDLPFLEVATQAEAVLITGNTAHYPEAIRGEVQVVAPGEFVRAWRK
ncbi:putative toxin-antitoxin system toxin component, PIN family [Candidatus Amarolinea aalborgensis]|jgi:putative PIN family toxin of toxin-antitoxin system|uniref:putative toxin-antitoxin system toxin component, PIN family n=1 Tax=Candidatus Amarolinea aalborgensis TaxID=2249329 RepID=UPI003BF9A808